MLSYELLKPLVESLKTYTMSPKNTHQEPHTGRTTHLNRAPDPLPQTHLSFGEVQPLSNLPPLYGTQVFVLAEGVLQLADLLRGELGPQPSLLGGFPLAVISHLALRPRSVTAAI